MDKLNKRILDFCMKINMLLMFQAFSYVYTWFKFMEECLHLGMEVSVCFKCVSYPFWLLSFGGFRFFHLRLKYLYFKYIQVFLIHFITTVLLFINWLCKLFCLFLRCKLMVLVEVYMKSFVWGGSLHIISSQY